MNDSTTKPSLDSTNKVTATAKNKGGSKFGAGKMFLFLLMLVLILGVAWSSWQLNEQSKEIDVLFASLTSTQAQSSDFNESMVRYARQSVEMEAQLRDANLASVELQARLAQQEMELQRVSDQLVDANLRQPDSSGEEVSLAWRLTEVESLLGLAEQHLLLGGNPDTALTLMLSADEVLKSLNDSTVYPVRSAIARDITQIRAMPDTDSEGIYLSLAAQFSLVNELQTSADLQAQLAGSTEIEGSVEGWFKKLGNAIGEIVSIRKLDGPLDPALTAEQSWYLKSRIMLLIEQARLAVRAQEQAVYSSALDQAVELAATWFEQNETAVSLISNLESLQEEEVVTPVPLATAGLQAIRQLIESWERGQAESQP